MRLELTLTHDRTLHANVSRNFLLFINSSCRYRLKPAVPQQAEQGLPAWASFQSRGDRALTLCRSLKSTFKITNVDVCSADKARGTPRDMLPVACRLREWHLTRNLKEARGPRALADPSMHMSAQPGPTPPRSSHGSGLRLCSLGSLPQNPLRPRFRCKNSIPSASGAGLLSNLGFSSFCFLFESPCTLIFHWPFG